MKHTPPFALGLALSLLCTLALPASLSGATATETKLAREILQTTGLKTGLALHIGAGQQKTPALSAALAEEGLLVHGLALDSAALARARKAIDAKNLAGRAMVEQVPVNPLPYLNDLANLVVVEDFAALAAQGLTREELLRVTAPGGVLCMRENGKWTKTIKPRPAGMDDWTHPQHGPDGNMVSADKLVTYPLGFRWLEGVPINLNRWAGCRGWVIANGRVFSLSSTELENVGPGKDKATHYLLARDAWNGLPLWKINCETKDDGAFLNWDNAGPLVADNDHVYAVKKDKPICVAAASGEIERTYPTKYAPARLLLSEGVLVAACWEGREPSKAKFNRDSLWATWVSRSTNGSVEAYDPARGNLKWSLPVAAENALAADGAVYLVRQLGNPPTQREVLAIDLQSGRERWRMASSEVGTNADLDLNAVGKGYVVVARRISGGLYGLSAKDGKVVWKQENAKQAWTPVVDDLLWVGGQKYDPITGEVKGKLAHGVSGNACTPSAIVNNILSQSRGCSYVALPPGNDPAAGNTKGFQYHGARGGCMEGMVPANGMFYTAQNFCRCAPGQVYGFMAVAPSGKWPTAADFEKERAIEKGPAFGQVDEWSASDEDWPFYRHDPERTGATPQNLPEGELKPGWKAQVVTPGEGLLANAWKSRLASPVSAPVVADKKVFVARTDLGQIAAYSVNNGRLLWNASLGARVDTPPAAYAGYLFVGAHDGYLYALRAKDGQLAWRARVAPWERRLSAFGQIESVWPAAGAVLVNDGVLYAHAGRTSESDGGVAVVAFNPQTGKQAFAKAIEPGPLRQNDLLRMNENSIFWHHVKIDPKSGAIDTKGPQPKEGSQGGIWDGSWTQIGPRRAGKAFQFGAVSADLLAWNNELVVAPNYAVTRDEASKPADPKNIKKKWQLNWPKGYQVEAITLTPTAVVYAGRISDSKTETTTGFLAIVSNADGKKITEHRLDAPPTYDGLAIEQNRILVSLQNGALVTFAK